MRLCLVLPAFLLFPIPVRPQKAVLEKGEGSSSAATSWLDYGLVFETKKNEVVRGRGVNFFKTLEKTVEIARKRLKFLDGARTGVYILGRGIRVDVHGGNSEFLSRVRSLLEREPLEFLIALDEKTGDLDPGEEKARLQRWLQDPKNRAGAAEDPFYVDRFNRLPSERGGPKGGVRIRWAPFTAGKGYGLPPSAVPFAKKGEKKGDFWAFLPLRMDLGRFTSADLDPSSLKIVPDLFGKPALSFAMKEQAGKAFWKWTRANAQHVMAGLLWGVGVTAPIIQEGLPGGGIFTKGVGGVQRKELERLIAAIRAGAFPVPLRLKDQGVYREEKKASSSAGRTRPPSAFRMEGRTGLPGAIRLYRADLPGPVRCFAVYVPQQAGWDIRVVKSGTPSGKEPLTSLAAKWKALVAVNGGYFKMLARPCREEGLLVLRGRIVSRPIQEVTVDKKLAWVSRAAAGFFPGARVEFTWAFLSKGRLWSLPGPLPLPRRPPSAPGPGWKRWSPPFALQAGPMLLRRGKAFIPRKLERLFAARDARHPRTALGTTGRRETVLLVVDGRQQASRGTSLAETAHILQRLGCREAINLDGGGSSTLVVRGKLWNLPQGRKVQRPVPNGLVVLPRRRRASR